MKRIILGAAVLAMTFLALAVAWPRALPGQQSERPHGIKTRVPWTTSRVTGSPDPPHPYRVERAFPRLAFRNPLLLVRAPGLDRLFVGEQAGRIVSFPDRQDADRVEEFLDLQRDVRSWDPKSKVRGIDALYGLVFHPKFAENRYCYVCYVLGSKERGRELPDGTRVSRFTVTNTDPPRIDPRSEKVLITWLAGGHNGCDLHFGNDGYLYISTGDATSPNPPDALDTGQDLSDLLSSILRIDVDRAANGRPYAIPADNPFRRTPNARPEIWSYGFRNPWRMSFDRVTGDLWVGDVGWERWEMVYRIKRGGNYGWSVMEGTQPVRPESRRGPTPILPPAIQFPHTEAASITGGYVYRGKRLKELVGAYICGDWVTRKLWATRFDGDKIVSHTEIAQGTPRVVTFGEDRHGELYFLDHNESAGLYQLVPNPAAKMKRADFPRKLSETGLFASVKDHVPAPGVVPFTVNAAQWNDHATSERFLALPGQETVRIYDSPIHADGFYSGQVFFSKDGVLAKTITLEMERGNPKSRRRLETQLLHFDGIEWRGYSYQWNDAQTDATLVPAAGLDRTLTVTDAQAPGGKRRQTWHYPSRTECLTCHNPWAGYTLAFTLDQLNRDHAYGNTTDNQLRALRHAGLIRLLHRERNPETDRDLKDLPTIRLADPHGAGASLDGRARSYLHVNCAHCHQFGAGGTADIELRHSVALDHTRMLEVRPVQGTFGIAGAQILAPADPYRSVLYYRMAKLGPGRMPHIGSAVVDERGLKLVHDWIRQLPLHQDVYALIERLRALDETRHRSKPAAAARARAAERATVIGKLLASTGSALMLSQAVGEGRIPAAVRPQVLAAAAATTDPQVRDLFERFLPDEQRVQRLGSVIRPEQLLARKGDVARGRALVFKATALQCVNCHRVEGIGSTLGPDLTGIGKKYTRAQLLESILDPSKTVEQQYVMYLLETTDGKVHTGLLAEKNGREVVLRTIGDKEVRVPAAEVATLAPQRASLMPDLLLRDVTAEQAADLLAFLASLR
ncbi:MAG: PQQ-dependent sugar dehydrogenase [Gemmataceae bacterium]|nr:PQQ-dependent sugar dehydrogenase [Gemmataceae bacterium]